MDVIKAAVAWFTEARYFISSYRDIVLSRYRPIEISSYRGASKTILTARRLSAFAHSPAEALSGPRPRARHNVAISAPNITATITTKPNRAGPPSAHTFARKA